MKYKISVFQEENALFLVVFVGFCLEGKRFWMFFLTYNLPNVFVRLVSK